MLDTLYNIGEVMYNNKELIVSGVVGYLYAECILSIPVILAKGVKNNDIESMQKVKDYITYIKEDKFFKMFKISQHFKKKASKNLERAIINYQYSTY